MQVEQKTEKGTVLLLKIENDYSVAGLNDGHIYFWNSSLLQSMGDYPLCVEIPSGNFEYIGLTSEVTEEQAKMIVDLYSTVKQTYVNYNKFVDKHVSCNTALDSLKSIMQHLQAYEINPFPLEECTCDVLKHSISHFRDCANSKIKHLEASKKTGKWVVLFKPNQQ